MLKYIVVFFCILFLSVSYAQSKADIQANSEVKTETAGNGAKPQTPNPKPQTPNPIYFSLNKIRLSLVKP